MPQYLSTDPNEGTPVTRGQLQPGNVDLYAQPVVKNPDGSTSTVHSFSVNIDGKEVLLPTVMPDGRHLSEEDAIKEYEKTGRHLGIFDSPQNATAYASRLHEDYAAGKYTQAPQVQYLSTDPNEGKPGKTAPPPTPQHPHARAAGIVGDVALGAAKGAANTVIGLGDLARSWIPGVQWASDEAQRRIFGDVISTDHLMDVAKKDYATPTNTAQQVGFYGEQIGEYFIPGAKAEKWATAISRQLPRAVPKILPRMGVEASINAGVTAAHGGDAGTAGAIGAAVPVAGRVFTGTANAVGRQAPKLVRAALKPTVTEMKQQAGASATGINAQADRLVDFILEHKLTSPEKAQAVIDAAESELRGVLAANRGVATDAPQRAQRYLAALERSAKRQGLPDDDVTIIRSKAKELLDKSPLSEDVTTTVLQPSPSGIVGPNGQPVMVPTQQTSRALRTDVGPEEALELARGSGKWGNRKAWGEQKGAARESSKAVERAERDAVKTAVPAARPILQREGQAIQAKKVLDRKAFREGNRDAVSPFDVTTAAVEVSSGRVPVLATARAYLRENQLKAGVLAKALKDAVARNDVKKTAEILARLGVGGYETPRPAQVQP